MTNVWFHSFWHSLVGVSTPGDTIETSLRPVVSSTSSAEDPSSPTQDSPPPGWLARGPSQFLAMWASPQAAHHTAQQASSVPANKSDVPSLCDNLIVRSASLGPACTRGGTYTGAWRPRGWTTGPILTWMDRLQGLMVKPRARMPGFQSQLYQLQLCDFKQVTWYILQCPCLGSRCDTSTYLAGLCRDKRVDICEALGPVSGT